MPRRTGAKGASGANWRLARLMTDYDNHIPPGEFMPRRFPPPWSVDEADPALDRRCFIVRDANGQALAYVYFEDEPGRRSSEAVVVDCYVAVTANR